MGLGDASSTPAIRPGEAHPAPQRDSGLSVSRHTSSTAAGAVDFSQSSPVQAALAAADSFELPALTPWQRRILGTAVSYVGFPYIWGGTGEGTPGFDCSGFVWRVYKLTSYVGEGPLAGALRGRTTMAMSGEAPRAARIAFESLQPGDVLFFGNGPRSKPAQIDHTGIYLGNGWFIHSSRYGVAVAALDGWQRSSFAWARRPLAEAGLAEQPVSETSHGRPAPARRRVSAREPEEHLARALEDPSSWGSGFVPCKTDNRCMRRLLLIPVVLLGLAAGGAFGSAERATASSAFGKISALSASSITVDGRHALTCRLSKRSPKLTGLGVGDRVGVACSDGVLRRIGRIPAGASTSGTVRILGAHSIGVDGERDLKCRLNDNSPGSTSSRSATRSRSRAPTACW